MTPEVLKLALLTMVAGAFVHQTLFAGELGEPRDVEFKSPVDRSTQRYVEMLPKDFDASQPHDVMIALHGHGSDRWQYVKQDRGECKGARDVAAERNMIFISPDYRATTSWMGPAAEADLVQIISLLRHTYKVRRVYLVGGSMGATSTLIFSALHPDLIAGMAAHNGTANMLAYESFQDAIIKSYGGTKEQRPDEYKKRSPELFPQRFTMPMGLTVGGKDTAVPPDSVRRLVAQLQKMGKKDLMLIDHPEGGHSTNYNDTVATIRFVIDAAEAKAAAEAKKEASKSRRPVRPTTASSATPAESADSAGSAEEAERGEAATSDAAASDTPARK